MGSHIVLECSEQLLTFYIAFQYNMATHMGSHIVLECNIKCKKLSIDMGSHILLKCNVKCKKLSIDMGSHIVLECNVKCKQLSIVPEEEGRELRKFGKRVKEKQVKKI